MLRTLILSAAALTICASSFAQQPVLKAESYWTINNANNLVPKDSVTYQHMPGKHTTVIPKSYAYSNNSGSYQYQYDTARSHRAVNNILEPAWELVQSFNSNGNFDTMWQNQYTNISSSYVPANRMIYTYLTGNKIDSVLTENYGNSSMTWAADRRTKYFYDTNNMLLSTNTKLWDATNQIWDIGHYDTFRYDNSGRTIEYEMFSYDLITNTLQQTQLTKYVYNNAGLKTVDTFFLNGVYNKITGYEYDANGNLLIDSSYTWIVNTLSWRYNGKVVYTYDVNNNRITAANHNWNTTTLAYVPSSRGIYTYNTTNQLTHVGGEKWDNGVWTVGPGASFLNYYYEAVPGNVAQYNDKQQPISLYPVPAVTYTNLEMNFDNPTDFSVIIFDMQGRIVKQFTDKADGRYKKNIIVQDMPAGQYMLQVKTATETMNRNITVIR